MELLSCAQAGLAFKRDPHSNTHLSDLLSLLHDLTGSHSQALTFDSSGGHIKLRMAAQSRGMDLLLLSN